MQVVNRWGKLPLNRALTLIKAIGKKKHKIIANERPKDRKSTRVNSSHQIMSYAVFCLKENQ